MSNVIQHPRAVEIVRKTERAAEAAKRKLNLPNIGNG